jgi:hypothetical protein
MRRQTNVANSDRVLPFALGAVPIIVILVVAGLVAMYFTPGASVNSTTRPRLVATSSSQSQSTSLLTPGRTTYDSSFTGTSATQVSTTASLTGPGSSTTSSQTSSVTSTYESTTSSVYTSSTFSTSSTSSVAPTSTTYSTTVTTTTSSSTGLCFPVIGCL